MSVNADILCILHVSAAENRYDVAEQCNCVGIHQHDVHVILSSVQL